MLWEKQPFLDDGDAEDSAAAQIELQVERPQRRKVFTKSWSRIIASVSILCNIVLIWSLFKNRRHCTSPFANLTRDVVSQFNTSSKYGLSTPDEATRSILWESLDTSAGEIALPKPWAARKGLPPATTFWWDASRSIYLVNGYHSLHCLRKVRRSIVLSHYNISQMDPYPHIVHCMDHLLQNIICEADDTPMYTSPERNAQTGNGQRRMCRSWDKLEAWVSSHSSCFAYINETQGVDEELKRFKYCSGRTENGRIADAAMRAHFDLPVEWNGERPNDIDSMPKYWESFQDG